MPIFHEHKAIFVHIPKTAGTTILRMFGYSEVPNNDMFYHMDDFFEYDHASAQLIKSREPEIYNYCYKFAIVRNPYDRLVSEYCWKKKDKDVRSVDVENMAFADFIKYLYVNFDYIQAKSQKEKSHFIPQSNFVLDDVEIFKFEEIDKLIGYLVKKYELPVPVEKYNSTQHEYFLNYYDDSLKSMVYDMYRTDFLLFGYDK